MAVVPVTIYGVAVINPEGGAPDNSLPGMGGHPDQGLPGVGRPPHVGNRPPGSGGGGHRPDQGLPPWQGGGGRPPSVWPPAPTDPDWGIDAPTTPSHPIWLPAGPDNSLPLPPAHPDHGLPGHGGHPDQGLPQPPTNPPPGTVWPPLPDGVPSGKAAILVFIPGVGSRYVVVDISNKPDQGLPPQQPGTTPPQPTQPPTAQPKR